MTLSIETFAAIYNRAAERKGGEENLEARISEPLTAEQLQHIGDDRYLAAFTKKVFQSGFVWRVVEQKWPAFEECFFQFDVAKVLLMPDEMLERKATNPDIIRNFNKVKTIRENAIMIEAVRNQMADDLNGQMGSENGNHAQGVDNLNDLNKASFARFVAQWPSDNIIGLWSYLKKHGSRLGGNTGPYALRDLGKDTFLLSQDVEGYFKARELITGSATSKRSLNTIQQIFNEWACESGRSLQAVSKIVSMSVGDNFV